MSSACTAHGALRGFDASPHARLQISTEWRGLELLPRGFHVAVSNHTCVGDFLLLYRQPARYTHLIHAAVPARGGRHRVRFMQATPAAFKTLRRTAERAEQRRKAATEAVAAAAHAMPHAAPHAPSAPPPAGAEAVDDELGSRPVHLFPEGGMTSGAGVMRFNRGFALLRAPVAPVAFRCTHAWPGGGALSTHTLTSSFAANLFWLCFAPATQLTATVLPPMTQRAGEGDAAFADRVRAAIAAELGVPALEMSIREKYALKETVRAVQGIKTR